MCDGYSPELHSLFIFISNMFSLISSKFAFFLSRIWGTCWSRFWLFIEWMIPWVSIFDGNELTHMIPSKVCMYLFIIPYICNCKNLSFLLSSYADLKKCVTGIHLNYTVFHIHFEYVLLNIFQIYVFSFANSGHLLIEVLAFHRVDDPLDKYIWWEWTYAYDS